VSEVNFSNCAGAIDGNLIWILKPLEEDAANAGCGRKKFFCGCKGKFRLNCQAVSDVRGRILDLSIGLPGASSDCIAFEGSDLYERLERVLLNSLTAIDAHERQCFDKLFWGLVTSTIFVHC